MDQKFYTGSKSSLPWVNDLLWKSHVTNESHQLKVPKSTTAKHVRTIPDVDSLPPHMQSSMLACVLARAQHAAMENPNVYADAGDMGLAPRRSVSRGSARSMGSRASARSAAMYRPPSVAGSVRSRGSRGSRRSQRSQRSRGSFRGLDRSQPLPEIPGSARRIVELQNMLSQERSQREKLAHDLAVERWRSKKLQSKMHTFQAKVTTSMGKSQRAREKTEKKLKSYQEVLQGLLKALDKKRQQQARNPQAT